MLSECVYPDYIDTFFLSHRHVMIWGAAPSTKAEYISALNPHLWVAMPRSLSKKYPAV